MNGNRVMDDESRGKKFRGVEIVPKSIVHIVFALSKVRNHRFISASELMIITNGGQGV